MMGKTNTVFAEVSETNELSLKVESILTDTTESIWKIEHINNIFFVFLNNNRVLYGEDIKSLQYLKKEEDYVNATHVIYIDQTYAFVDNHLKKEPQFEIYKTQDLKQFTIYTIETSDSSYTWPMGIFLSSNKKVIILFEIGYGEDVYLGVFDEINDSIESMTGYTNTGFRMNISNTTDEDFFRNIRIFKDRLFIPIIGYGNGGVIMSLAGEYSKTSNLQNVFFVGDVVIYVSNYSVYYSQNGYDSSLLGKSPVSSDIKVVTVNENNIGIFYDQKFAFAESYKDIIDAFKSEIDEKEIIGSIICSCPVGEYTYLGCSGGMIYKIFVDFSGSDTTPSISVLKTLSAKQALADSKNYTDKKYAELEARIAALEANMED